MARRMQPPRAARSATCILDLGTSRSGCGRTRQVTAPTYFDHYAGQTSRQPGDLVEMDPYIVLEGEAAEDTIRRFYDAAIRAAEAVQ